MSDNTGMKAGLVTIFVTAVLGMSSLLSPSVARAEWVVVRNAGSAGQENNQQDTLIAQIRNEENYLLEIYRDSVNAVRGKLTLAGGLIAFAGKSCPTFQIDKGPAMNLSINNVPCLSDAVWAEYILGYVADSRVESSPLLGMMNGVRMTFRFRLKNGDYRSTDFSLQGSRRALTEAIGSGVAVLRSSS